MSQPQERLNRTLGYWALLVYGVGDILGAGIYALVGQIAGLAGSMAWLAFLIALVTAVFTALTYAELTSRFPHSGGASFFCQEAFGRQEPAFLVGWLVFCSGVVSTATLAVAFAGYASVAAPRLHQAFWIVGFLLFLSLINYLGMTISALANWICTAVEVTGLVIVVAVGAIYLSTGPHGPPAEVPAAAEPVSFIAILRAGALAFYAYIGFEDLVNVAEESRHPERYLPRALLTALAIAGVLYLAVITVSIGVLTPRELGQSEAPLLAVVRRAAPNFPLGLFLVIPLFAVANSALMNGIMASRLLYGMTNQQLLPRWMGAVDPRFKTPFVAITFVFLVATTLAVTGGLVFLAGTVSVLLLAVFFMVHLSLVRIHWRERRGSSTAEAGFRVPRFIPFIGLVTVAGLACFVPTKSAQTAAIVLALGLVVVVGRVWVRR